MTTVPAESFHRRRDLPAAETLQTIGSATVQLPEG
ncbi:MAG: hypothetical protein K0S98_574, partial [Propionibacteriaceae bacterium]|nr:hypothetical protein [Propionibacteriaceae bacterium]